MEQKKLHSMITKFLRLAAWILITVIVALSMVPPFIRPRTGAPHDVEHFSIFVLASLVFGLSYRFSHFYQAIGFVVFTATLEVAQLVVPGRHARIGDFIVDAASSCIGILAAWLIVKAMSHRAIASIDSCES
jgi:hypothetical protein